VQPKICSGLKLQHNCTIKASFMGRGRHKNIILVLQCHTQFWCHNMSIETSSPQV